MYLYMAHVSAKLSFGPHLRVTFVLRQHVLAFIALLLHAPMQAKPSSWSMHLSLIQA